MHYSEVQKQTQNLYLGIASIYAADGGMGNAAKRLPKVDKGFMARGDNVVLKLKNILVKILLQGFLLT